MIKVDIQTHDFDISTELAALRLATDNCGAMASFIGLVRGKDEASHVDFIELEHYPVMAEKSITQIAQLAMQRWSVDAVRVIHRVGKLPVGAQIVLVLTAAQHRKAAFAACEFVMDYLKAEAPFWKKEILPAGERWVEAKVSDLQAQQAWLKK